MIKKYILPHKIELKKIKISDITVDLPDLKHISASKAIVIAKWMMSWIDSGLKSGQIRNNNLLPVKAEFAYMLGVSVGTIQNALRYIEDAGYVESKQCLGTFVKNPRDCNSVIRKLTSKREIAISEIKKYIKKNNLVKGQNLPSSRFFASIIGCSSNTARLALEYLCSVDILEHKFKNPNKDTGWIVKSTEFEVEKNTEHKTLVKQIETDLKDYITENLSPGAKMPPHNVLSDKLKTSITTIHTGLKTLIDEGILLARRGRYGTVVMKMPNDRSVPLKKETSIFAPAPETAFYYYEKTQNHLKKMIGENYEIGSKLPSIIELSKQLDISPNTIRKAFANLAKEGYLAFARGRYGGTFVIDIPETETQSFKWLAVNPQYTRVYK